MAAALYGSIVKLVSERELRLDFENAKLRQLLAQAGIDAAQHTWKMVVQRMRSITLCNHDLHAFRSRTRNWDQAEACLISLSA